MKPVAMATTASILAAAAAAAAVDRVDVSGSTLPMSYKENSV